MRTRYKLKEAGGWPVVVLLLLCVAAVLAGCRQQEASYAPAPPPTVTVENPVLDEVTVYAESPGRFAASDSVEVLARVAGFIDAIHFDDGERVEQDQLLFSIERGKYASAVRRAEASLASAKASLALAEATLERLEKAVETNAVSRLDVLEAQAKKGVSEANVDVAETALADARLNLSYTEVRAPFNGITSEALVSVGDYARAGGQDILARVTALDPIYCYFNASERGLLAYRQQGKTIPRAETGKSIPEDKRVYVKLKLADDSVYEREGYIDYAAPEIDSQTGTLRVRVRVPNPENHLYPGQYARVMLTLFAGEAVLVPEVAVVRDVVGPHLLSVADDNTVVRRDVKLGALLEGRRVIEEGVQPDSRIITAGVQRARVGMPVDPQPPVMESADSESLEENTKNQAD